MYPRIIPDDVGGAIITWSDWRSDTWDIYAQRIDMDGYTQWTADGVIVCSAAGHEHFPQIVADGSNGAIITWHDGRAGYYDIYVQRIDAGGNVMWEVNGVPVCTADGDQWIPQICADDAGGAIIAWRDYRDGVWDVYAQRISAEGYVHWMSDGVAVCTVGGWDEWCHCYHRMIPDREGGTIIAWRDNRSGNEDIYAQHIDSSGNAGWVVNGVAVCTANEAQRSPQIVNDGAGGAIITWHDYRSGLDIYAQRIDSCGNILWASNGIAVCSAPDYQYNPHIVPDNNGGVFIAWWDYRSGNGDIYAQRIDTSGAALWATDGIAVCTAAGEQGYFGLQIIPDGGDGAILVWDDERNEDIDVFCQRINTSGVPQWRHNGAHICRLPVSDQEYPQLISDDSGGAIVTWMDCRLGQKDIYAQRITAVGDVVTHADVNPKTVKLYQNSPNPFNPITSIRFVVPEKSNVKLRIYDVSGKLIRTLMDGEMGPDFYETFWDGTDEGGRKLSSGVYFCRLTAGSSTITKKMVLIK